MCIYIIPCLIRSFTPGKFSQFSKQNRNNKGIKNWKLRLIEFSKKISVLVMNMGYFHAYFHNMNRDTFEHSQKISIMEPFANRKKFDFRYLTRFCTRLWRKQVFLQIILISSVWNMWNLYWWLLPSTSKLAKPIQKKVEVSIN